MGLGQFALVFLLLLALGLEDSHIETFSLLLYWVGIGSSDHIVSPYSVQSVSQKKALGSAFAS